MDFAILELAAHPLCLSALVASSLVLVVGLYYVLFIFCPAEMKGKSVLTLSGGSLPSSEVKDSYQAYTSFFDGKPNQIDTLSQLPSLVDTYYNLVTDIYEWGWGQSFHFSPAVPGLSHRQATILHEQRVADRLHIKPGDKILDAGCGIGGPMRTIAAYSAAEVVGITINDYQVSRARSHNRKAGLHTLCKVVCGNFLSMPFPDNSFDGAYSIEATCHAPKLHDVYAEIYRVLKPGKFFVSHEWVTTPAYNPENKEHKDLIRGIEVGNALPDLRSYKEIVEIAKEVGFEVLVEKDLALPPALPWWERLKMGKFAHVRNHVLVSVLSFLGVTPKGVADVHAMLCTSAVHLTRGAEAGIFTPMHLLVCRKPY